MTPPVLPAKPSAEQVLGVLEGINSQVQQAADNGGQPRELTREEVQKILDDQLASLGIKP